MAVVTRAPADQRAAAALVGFGLAPFVAAAAIDRAGDAAPELPCPFLLLTGLPCPLCGATRAFALAANGDAAFLDFNAVWVVVAAIAVVVGLVSLLRHRRAARITLALPSVLLIVALGAWAWALAHRAQIVT